MKLHRSWDSLDGAFLCRAVILAFVAIFPIFFTRQLLDGSEAKFWVLAIAFFLLTPVMLKLVPANYRFANLCQSHRILYFATGIFSIYALGVFGVCIQTLALAPALLLWTHFWICRCQLEERIPAAVLRAVFVLIAIALAAGLTGVSQYSAFCGDGYRHTGVVTLLLVETFFIGTVLSFRSEKDRARLWKTILISAVPVCVYGLLQYTGYRIFPWFTHGFYSDRSMSTLGHPNWFGTYLILVLAVAFYRLYQKPGFWPLAVCCLIHANILTSLTRGAWIACVAMCALLLFWHARSSKTAWLFAGLLATTLALLPLNDWKLAKRMASLDQETEYAADGSDATGSGRFYMWRWTAQWLPRYGLLGSGLDTIPDLSTPKNPAPLTKAHNIYLEYGVTLGIPGMIVYLFLVCKCLTFSKDGLFGQMLRILLFGYLVQAIFIHDTIHSWPLLWIIMAAAVAFEASGSTGSRGFCSVTRPDQSESGDHPVW